MLVSVISSLYARWSPVRCLLTLGAMTSTVAALTLRSLAPFVALLAALAGAAPSLAGCASGGEEGVAAGESNLDESDARTDAPSCDLSRVRCEIPTPECPDGEVPSVDAARSCYGACVPAARCAPKTLDCEPGPALCRMVPPECGPGERLTTRGACFGPCVPEGVCK